MTCLHLSHLPLRTRRLRTPYEIKRQDDVQYRCARSSAVLTGKTHYSNVHNLPALRIYVLNISYINVPPGQAAAALNKAECLLHLRPKKPESRALRTGRSTRSNAPATPPPLFATAPGKGSSQGVSFRRLSHVTSPSQTLPNVLNREHGKARGLLARCGTVFVSWSCGSGTTT
jgi:hypothetical protein